MTEFCILEKPILVWNALTLLLDHAGCKESQFYSLPFGQAVASMYWPESHFNKSQKKLDEHD